VTTRDTDLDTLPTLPERYEWRYHSGLEQHAIVRKGGDPLDDRDREQLKPIIMRFEREHPDHPELRRVTRQAAGMPLPPDYTWGYNNAGRAVVVRKDGKAMTLWDDAQLQPAIVHNRPPNAPVDDGTGRAFFGAIIGVTALWFIAAAIVAGFVLTVRLFL